jgi:prepilin signal peptidase PulO-like enzyme (type II secretory pathway)
MSALIFPLTLLGLAILGACVGAAANWAAYALAWNARPISPWSAPHPKATPRGWTERIPIFGWLRLRREAPIFGAGHWVRPMLVELGMGAGFAWLYWWEVERAALVRPQLESLLAALYGYNASLAELASDFVVPRGPLLAALFAHLALVVFMLVAALIDIDERLTSDAVLIPGTLLGLAIAALVPWSALPFVDWGVDPPRFSQPLELQSTEFAIEGEDVIFLRRMSMVSPQQWPDRFDGRPRGAGLALGLACYAVWCFALLPRPWYGRRGWRRAGAICLARMARSARSPAMLGLVAVGVVGVVGVWSLGGARWAGLLSALVGLVVAGGVVWSIRLVGKAALGKEAMGFGDVLFMMMVGAFVGWQAGVLVFFLAPLAAVAFGLVNWITRQEREIFYVPFLATATLGVIVSWAPLAAWSLPIFAHGRWLLAAGGICLALVWVMLALWRTIQNALWPEE